ncbi:MAG TPA: hypothetical protein VMI06_15285 [Terriglobia bacterium]|nr:hypothetical protein [Terriglobia bacterium]
MIATTTASRIGGYYVAAYKGTAEGETYGELLKSAEALGANAILNTCYDDALDVDTLFHGAAVVIEPIPASLQHLATNVPVFESAQAVERTKEPR